MKKILLLLLTVFLSTLFVSCAKVPFTKSVVKKNASLVYVYAIRKSDSIDAGTRIQVYKISINGKTTKGFVKAYEYATYDLKPGPIEFTASRNDVERHKLDLELEEGKTYYIRLNSFGEDWGEFNFELVSESKALKEMEETTLAGAYETNNSVISALIPADEDKNEALVTKAKAATGMNEEELEAMIDAKVAAKTAVGTAAVKSSSSKTGSKLDEIKDAFEMKKAGVLSEEEFLKMKTEILAK